MCLSRFRCKCKFAGIEVTSKPKFHFFFLPVVLWYLSWTCFLNLFLQSLLFQEWPVILNSPLLLGNLMKPWDAQHPWKSAKFKIKCEVNTMFFPFSFFHHLFKLLWNKPNNFAMSSFFSGSQPTHSYLVSLILSSWERTVLGVRFDTPETQCV